MQEHVQPMDQEGHSIGNQQFDFNNPHVLQSHVANSPHVFDPRGQFSKNVMGYPSPKFPGVNFHDMSMQQPKPHGEGFSEEEEDYGQSPQRRKLDDVVQRQKHSNREKKRRNEMNESIEALKLLLPQSDKSRFRVTKVSILNEGIEYIQRIKELCLVLAKDKREIYEENCRLHQQLIALGKDVGELRRWDDRNLLETLQSSITLSPNPLKRDAGQMEFGNEFGKRFDGPPGFPFVPAHLAPPFGHPGMMQMHPGMRIPPGRPMMGGPMDFNSPMGFPMFPHPPGRIGPNGQIEHPGFPIGFPGQPGEPGQEAMAEAFNQQHFQQQFPQQPEGHYQDGQDPHQQHQEQAPQEQQDQTGEPSHQGEQHHPDQLQQQELDQQQHQEEIGSSVGPE